ncbi:hypothetical protein ACOMHN_001020 [Nucella lapillus]
MTGGLITWLRSAAVLSAVCTFTAASGFEWHNSEEPQMLSGCVGSPITLSWGFSKEPYNSLGTIHWLRFARQTVASYVDGQVTNPDKRFTPVGSGSAADLTIAGLTTRDTGLYEVDVKILSKNPKGKEIETVHSASAMLMVGDPPIISGDRLTTQEVTSEEGCALLRQVTLRCGHFLKRGVPPVEAVWTDPAGQQLPSTRYVDGYFELVLPRRPLAGNYTCHALCKNPVLQCLPPDTPLKTAPQIRIQGPNSLDGCSEADRQNVDKEQPSGAASVSSPRAVRRLESNLTELSLNVAKLEREQTQLKNQNDERRENFRVKVEELRELVLLANQQSSGAQSHALERTLLTLQNVLHDVQQNVTALQQRQKSSPVVPPQEGGRGGGGGGRGGGGSRGGGGRGGGGGEGGRGGGGGEDNDQRFQDIQNTLVDLRAKLEASNQKIQSLEEKIVSVSVGLALTQTTVTSLEESLINSGQKVEVPSSISQEHSQNITNLWDNLDRLEQIHADTLQEVRGVTDSQRRLEKRQDNLTQSLSGVSSRVDGLEHGLGRRVDRAVRLCNVTKHDMSRLERKLQRVERGQAMPVEAAAAASVAEEGMVMEPGIGGAHLLPLPPWDGEKDSLMHDFLILPGEGNVVIADRYRSDVILASNVSAMSDVTAIPLRYGSHIRHLTTLPDGVVAATLDDRYIFILDTTTDDPNDQQRWVRTPHPYNGIAARSAQTLFVGVSAKEGGGMARIDVISIVDDAAIIVSTVMNGSVTPQLQDPYGMTLHGEDLYVCDWKSSYILRLSLQTLQVTVISGPGRVAELHDEPRFFQPRHMAFDVSGNMYVTTGGKLCGSDGGHFYSRGFCVVVISQEGSWEKLVTRGQHIYPYGLALTPTGLAVSWGSWVQNPTRSLIQWYDLVHPNV